MKHIIIYIQHITINSHNNKCKEMSINTTISSFHQCQHSVSCCTVAGISFLNPLSQHRTRADVTLHAKQRSNRAQFPPSVICTGMHVSCLQTDLTYDAFLIIWHLRLTWLCACGASVYHSIYSTQLTVFPSLYSPSPDMNQQNRTMSDSPATFP